MKVDPLEQHSFPGFKGVEVGRPGLAEVNHFFRWAWRMADVPAVAALGTVDRD